MDSNVVLYLLSEDAEKAECAEAVLRRRPIISVQVLNEVTHVCVRKLKMGWGDVGQFLALVREFCTIVPVTVEVHDRARELAARHQLSFYDACIVAAAAAEGCQTLFSEDMHHGLIIEESLSIRNPFNV
ncbi:PIN domain-containing protein [Xanthomonas sp. CFBP 8445]|uniref:PIN domain-containing protein n=1 Tax=Xanthomonas sp. CFBP 8445 TaxID=2971236 RepID=UPI0021E04BEC|nr:PIN domain-containing protein [Xanthomonas sp. CFBP 8445]UYC11824.1 PIN domain-containing protein [Xanthomonas sp. CFBP 8445]